ncbi:MAG: hypothetical protein ABIF10_01125 [Candidatus Woesearchaeota archaeon]
MNQLEEMLRKFKIIGCCETYESMCDRVFHSVTMHETRYSADHAEIEKFRNEIKAMFIKGEIVPSTPILTNAGRYADKPLTACSVPPLSLRQDLKKTKEVVDQYHQKGMGTGFNFDDCENPVEILDYLNRVALEGQKSGKEDRPVGNMAVISCDHPMIEEFVQHKSKNKHSQWAFNISVNVKKELIESYRTGQSYTLSNGKTVDAGRLLGILSENAWECGDPGIVFMERFDETNPVPQLGKYKSLAPCGEVAMTEGETCQFAYINLAKFVDKD